MKARKEVFSMPLQIVRNDITNMKVDAIVNAANSSLLGGGGVDGCIHRAAGPKLLEECRKLHGCQTGDAKITHGYNLPCHYVIHTVGPIWKDGHHKEKQALESCYKKSLQLAKEYHCQSVAFPLISAGVYGYPKEQALKVAVETISTFLLDNEMHVSIVIFNRKDFQISNTLLSDLKSYIEDHNQEEVFPMRAFSFSPASPTLEEALSQMDESFSEMLLRKIEESGMSDVQCYKKANIDRRLFSKIRSDPHYQPSKMTVLAFALALELPLSEIQDMLSTAGFTLSHSSKSDVIVMYFVENGNYNINEINEALFAFDQHLIGSF
jgi:O-acetyl-ADP-ribose deacetylase (regulator of RNase III)